MSPDISEQVRLRDKQFTVMEWAEWAITLAHLHPMYVAVFTQRYDRSMTRTAVEWLDSFELWIGGRSTRA